MEAEYDDHHGYVDAGEKRETPLHETLLSQRFHGDSDHYEHYNRETRERGKIPIHIEPEGAGNVYGEYKRSDENGGSTSEF